MIERLMLRASDPAANGGDPLAALNPELIIGPMLLGLALNIWLYGMQLMQVEVYFRSNPRDSVWVKGVVVFLLVADTLSSIFDVWFTYDYCVKKFGDKAAIMYSSWVFNTEPVMTVIVSSTVQSFFGWRVHKLTGQTWLAALIGVSAIVQFFLGTGVGIACGIIKEFTKFHKFTSIVIVWLVLAPITDIAISVALVWFLQRNKTGFAVTDDLVGKITRLTIQTGAITAVWATIDLTLFVTMTNNIHLIFNMPLAKLYSNCLMSSLNARRLWGASTSYTSGEPPTTGKTDMMRGGIHVTTTTGVTHETYEMNPQGKPFDGSVSIGGTGATDIKRKTIDDGLSLRSDSDVGIEDPLGDRQKLADEETRPAAQHIQPITPRVQMQAHPPAGGRGANAMGPNPRHPYANMLSPGAPPVARGGRHEVNVEWGKEL